MSDTGDDRDYDDCDNECSAQDNDRYYDDCDNECSAQDNSEEVCSKEETIEEVGSDNDDSDKNKSDEGNDLQTDYDPSKPWSKKHLAMGFIPFFHGARIGPMH